MTQALLLAGSGTGFTFLMTALGAAMVFLFRNQISPNLHRIMLGFAAGDDRRQHVVSPHPGH